MNDIIISLVIEGVYIALPLLIMLFAATLVWGVFKMEWNKIMAKTRRRYLDYRRQQEFWSSDPHW